MKFRLFYVIDNCESIDLIIIFIYDLLKIIFVCYRLDIMIVIISQCLKFVKLI